ncbi:NAD-dependent epimerase/dehydratase family protein [Desulfolithobacter sp.]
MNIKSALVTGGGGFVGLALTRALRQAGVKVTVLGRHAYPEVLALGAKSLVGDIRDLGFVNRAMCGQEVVFHVAALAGVWGPFHEYYSINVTGTLNVLAACLRNRVRHLVYTSTPSVVFDGDNLRGADESLPYASRPLCAYAATKIIAEREVLAMNNRGLRTIAVRPHLVYGPGDTNLIPRLLARGREGSLKIVGTGDNRVDLTYIDNVVQAHLLAALDLMGPGRGAGRPFFVSDGTPIQLWPWINNLFTACGIRPVKARVPFRLAWIMGSLLEVAHSLTPLEREPKMTRFIAEQLARDHWFNIEAAANRLGYVPEYTTKRGTVTLLESMGRSMLESFSAAGC